MNKERILKVADEESVALETAHTLLIGLYEQYFGNVLQTPEERKAACKEIADDLEYIAAILWVADGLVFQYRRAMDAAMGVETVPVEAFIRNTRDIYGAFLDEPRKEQRLVEKQRPESVNNK